MDWDVRAAPTSAADPKTLFSTALSASTSKPFWPKPAGAVAARACPGFVERELLSERAQALLLALIEITKIARAAGSIKHSLTSYPLLSSLLWRVVASA